MRIAGVHGQWISYDKGMASCNAPTDQRGDAPSYDCLLRSDIAISIICIINSVIIETHAFILKNKNKTFDYLSLGLELS